MSPERTFCTVCNKAVMKLSKTPEDWIKIKVIARIERTDNKSILTKLSEDVEFLVCPYCGAVYVDLDGF